MVFVRLSVRPGVDLGFKTSTNGQDLDGRTGPSLEIKVQVLKSKSGGLPKVNTRVFFSPPFSGELPRVNTTVFCFSALSKESGGLHSVQRSRAPTSIINCVGPSVRP